MPISQEKKQLLILKEENYRRYEKLFKMIDEKNLYQMTNEQFAYILNLIDQKYEDSNFNQYNYKEIN